MKLKYYLRGLGIGIVVTALLMGFATKGAGELSDEEVIARAKELGMVEQRTLADIRDNVEPTQIPEEGQNIETVIPTKAPGKGEQQGNDTPIVTEIPLITALPEVTNKPEITEMPQKTEAAVTTAPVEKPQESEIPSAAPTEEKEEIPLPTAEISGDVVQVTIYEGNHSVNVSKVLEESGLVESATAFDRYLRNNGYSKIINTGVHKIKIGTPEEEIARIITNTD